MTAITDARLAEMVGAGVPCVPAQPGEIAAVVQELRAARALTAAKPVTVKPLDLSTLLRDAFLAGRGLIYGDKLSEADQRAWAEYNPERLNAFKRVTAALSQEHVAGESEPIPENVYYSVDGGNFYNASTHVGMGTIFWDQWRGRISEFPQRERHKCSYCQGTGTCSTWADLHAQCPDCEGKGEIYVTVDPVGEGPAHSPTPELQESVQLEVVWLIDGKTGCAFDADTYFGSTKGLIRTITLDAAKKALEEARGEVERLRVARDRYVQMFDAKAEECAHYRDLSIELAMRHFRFNAEGAKSWLDEALETRAALHSNQKGAGK